jgi:myo-inositol 2-dehydrogenase / D-chiro-inositol 1-dehydrogenase
VRIAVLGAGRIGRAHIENLAGLDRVEEIVVHDPHRAADLVTSARVAMVDTAEEAIERSDGVVVASPTDHHPDDVRRVAAAGLPCFCEKPLSLDLATSEGVVAQADAAGIELQVGFQRRSDPGFLAMKGAIEQGRVGEVHLVRAASHDHEPPHESYLPGAGSIFRDMLIHDFDAVPWLLDDTPVEVFARGAVLVDEMFAHHGDVDTCAAVVTMAGGTIAVLTGTRQNGVGYDHRTEVIGSKDSLSAGLVDRMPLRSADPGGFQPVDPFPTFPVRFRAAYVAEMAAFVALVAAEGPNRCPGRAAVDALRLAVAADRSLATGQPVRVADAG